MQLRTLRASSVARAQYVARFMRAFAWRDRLRVRSKFNQAFAKNGVGLGMIVRDGLIMSVELTDPNVLFPPPRNWDHASERFNEVLRDFEASQKKHIRPFRGIVPACFIEGAEQRKRRQARNKRKAARRARKP